MSNAVFSPYYNEDALQADVAQGNHRNAIGGLWDKMGELQRDFLMQNGLQPRHRLLDIGCGSLRLGHLMVDFLESGHYFGNDLSEELISAGYAKELSDEQRAKLPRTNLGVSNDFDFSFLKEKMDFAIAQSVFSHLPLNHIRRCLMKLAPHMEKGGVFYATFFHCPDHHDVTKPLKHPMADDAGNQVTTHDYKDPYHYTLSDLEYCAQDTKWKVQVLGDWNHPRNQQMAAFLMQG